MTVNDRKARASDKMSLGMIRWLGPRDPFPPVDVALKDPNGLLRGRDFAERLLDAYVAVFFPWSGPDDRCSGGVRTADGVVRP